MAKTENKKPLDLAAEVVKAYETKYHEMLENNDSFAKYQAIVVDIERIDKEKANLDAMRQAAMQNHDARKALDLDKQLASLAAERNLVMTMKKEIDHRNALPADDKKRFTQDLNKDLAEVVHQQTADLENAIRVICENASTMAEISRMVDALVSRLESVQNYPCSNTLPSQYEYERATNLAKQMANILRLTV